MSNNQNNCLLRIKISHRAFEKYDIYIDSKKKNIINRKSYSKAMINTACNEGIEILIRKRNILEKWYWFICLFNIFNFFYAFSFYRSFSAFYDSGNITYRIKIRLEEKIKEINLDLEIDNKEYGDKNFYQAVKRIETSGIAQLSCCRIPSSARYKNRWRSSKICSLVLYVAASYVFIMAKMIFGDVKIDVGLIIYAAVSFSLCVYYVVTVLKTQSIFDVIKNNETVWEKKSV